MFLSKVLKNIFTSKCFFLSFIYSKMVGCTVNMDASFVLEMQIQTNENKVINNTWFFITKLSPHMFH